MTMNSTLLAHKMELVEALCSPCPGPVLLCLWAASLRTCWLQHEHPLPSPPSLLSSFLSLTTYKLE